MRIAGLALRGLPTPIQPPIALQQNDQLIASTSRPSAKQTVTLVRLNQDGSADPSFAFQASALVTGSLALSGAPPLRLWVQPNGKILMAGLFTNVNGTARNQIARLNSDGSLDAAFDVGPGIGFFGPLVGMSPPQALVVQPDGKILVAGYFTSINGVSAHYVVRLFGDPLFKFVSTAVGPDGVFKCALTPSNLGRVSIESSADLRIWKRVTGFTNRIDLLEYTSATSRQTAQFYRAVGE